METEAHSATKHHEPSANRATRAVVLLGLSALSALAVLLFGAFACVLPFVGITLAIGGMAASASPTEACAGAVRTRKRIVLATGWLLVLLHAGLFFPAVAPRAGIRNHTCPRRTCAR